MTMHAKDSASGLEYRGFIVLEYFQVPHFKDRIFQTCIGFDF